MPVQSQPSNHHHPLLRLGQARVRSPQSGDQAGGWGFSFKVAEKIPCGLACCRVSCVWQDWDPRLREGLPCPTCPSHMQTPLCRAAQPKGHVTLGSVPSWACLHQAGGLSSCAHVQCLWASFPCPPHGPRDSLEVRGAGLSLHLPGRPHLSRDAGEHFQAASRTVPLSWAGQDPESQAPEPSAHLPKMTS